MDGYNMATNFVNFPGQPAPKKNILGDAFKILAEAYAGKLDAQTKILDAGLKSGDLRVGLGGTLESVPMSEQPEYMKAKAYSSDVAMKNKYYPDIAKSQISENLANALSYMSESGMKSETASATMGPGSKEELMMRLRINYKRIRDAYISKYGNAQYAKEALKKDLNVNAGIGDAFGASDLVDYIFSD